MRLGLACLAATALVIAGYWTWLGAPVGMPSAPLTPGEKLYCLSYAPFRGSQTPADPTTRISAEQIRDDLTRLARITNCIRTYSVDFGLDQIAGIAESLGLKVLQGLWLSSHADKNQFQIETAVALANKYPDTIRAVVVGNEVLLRGEMSGLDLAATLRAVKARVKMPVTYADVWEFWLKNRDVANAADFITIHILPYWEDFPIAAENSGAHVASIYGQVRTSFPGKEIIIGEVGWPSAGRMREGALPSPANQARVIQDVLAWSKRDDVKVNVIEAFDAPWKRALEGTVGGHWGLFYDASRTAKFEWGAPVSNHAYWRWQAAGGIAFAVLVFGVAMRVRGRDATTRQWLAVTACALSGGMLIGWAAANAPLESLGTGGWLRSLALVAIAFTCPLIMTAMIVRQMPTPAFAQVIGPADWRVSGSLARAAGAVAMATLVVAILIALGLVFDPRYKDFPFAPLTAAVVPLLANGLVSPRPVGRRGAAEVAGAAVLALSVIYIVPNEGLANWQALWTCGAFAALALTLMRARDGRG